MNQFWTTDLPVVDLSITGSWDTPEVCVPLMLHQNGAQTHITWNVNSCQLATGDYVFTFHFENVLSDKCLILSTLESCPNGINIEQYLRFYFALCSWRGKKFNGQTVFLYQSAALWPSKGISRFGVISFFLLAFTFYFLLNNTFWHRQFTWNLRLTQKHEWIVFFFILLINFILKTCFYANILFKPTMLYYCHLKNIFRMSRY